MIGRILAVALNTFRDSIRSKVPYVILLLVIGANLFAIVLGEMSLHEEARVARDVGLGAVSLCGSILAIILGVTLLYREIQRKTIYLIITKPIERWEFVLGKFFGMVATLTLLVVAFAVAMAGLLYLQGVPFDAAVLKALVLAYMEVMLVAALAIFFSSFSSPYLSGLFTFLIWVLGRVTPEMRAAAESAKSAAVRSIAEAGLWLVPDLHLFSVSGGTVGGEHVSVHGSFVAWSYVSTAGLYALIYGAALLVLAMVIFSRRNFV